MQIGAPRISAVDEEIAPPPPILTRRRDPDANQETWLIRYDDIRVGSIVKRQGPMELESSLLFGVASLLPAGTASHAMRPALPSEGKGHTFESCRVRHKINCLA